MLESTKFEVSYVWEKTNHKNKFSFVFENNEQKQVKKYTDCGTITFDEVYVKDVLNLWRKLERSP